MAVDELSEGLQSVRLINIIASFCVVLAEVNASDPVFNKLRLG